MKKLIPTIALSGAAIICVIIGLIIGLEQTSLILTSIFLILAIGSFIALSFFKVNKMLILVPILSSLVFVGIFESVFSALMLESSSSSTAIASSPVLSLLITAALVVGLIYAIKGQKWASILTIVILGIEIAVNAQLFISLVAISETFESFGDNSLVNALPIVNLGIIFVYISFVLKFIPALQNKVEE